MGFTCGIVGLPNVGKSTLFNALTAAAVQAENYPFCTIDPNVGVVAVPDERLDRISAMFKPKKTTPTTIEFVDIAGLVRGASQGEGLGNQFLSHIRQVDAVAHIVRCFEDNDVVHVEGKIDPASDIDTIHTELCLADLDTVTRVADRAVKAARSGEKALLAKSEMLVALRESLARGNPARSFVVETEDAKTTLHELHLLTNKPVLYVCNTSEHLLGKPNRMIDAVRKIAQSEGAQVVEVSAKVEAEIVQLPPEERVMFLKELGLTESGLSRVIRAGYDLLGLITYFTAGEDECRAWTITKGMRAPQSAGVIHSDFERGFICAEIYHYDDLIACGSEAGVKSKGLLRTEGKSYVMKDGDLAHFRFNV